MHEELVKSLRCCVTDFNSIQSRLCNKCQYAKYADGKYGCENKLKADAADAIEYLILQNENAQHAIRGLDATCNWLIKEYERLKDGYEARKRDEEYEEWLHDDRPCPDFAREE